MSSNGVGEEKEWLTERGIFHSPTSVSPDGRFLLYDTRPHDRTKAGLWVLPLHAGSQPLRLLGPEFNSAFGSFSPDGRWVAYKSDESGRSEIYVRPFLPSGPAGPSLGKSQWQASRDGADLTTPRWRKDGKELFFMDTNNVIDAVNVDGSGGAFQMGTPKALVTAPCSCSWDVTPDGNRFLVTTAQGAGGNTPITVVLNWQADLKRQ